MEKLKTFIKWTQFLGWIGLWLWSAIADDSDLPWRMMFAIVCYLNAFDRAFDMGR